MAEHPPPALRTVQMPHFPLRILVWIAVVIALLGLLKTSIYTVQAESEGVVLRFGKFLNNGRAGSAFQTAARHR